MSRIRYNERSWAIDLISLINQKAPNLRGRIQKAGGEQTICGAGECMFPDVLLFGENCSIAMGWELKMPDTRITDNELIENAKKKADILKTTGFLLWNVNVAVLYMKDAAGFSPAKTWCHDQQKQIKDAFRPISRRSVLPLQDELDNADRLIFDEVVLSCFGISKYRENIEQSLRWLHRRRCLPRD